MARLTNKEKLLASLKEEGFVEGTSRSTKYVVLERSGKRLFVGSKGALRTGRTITGSLPVRQTVIDQLLIKGAEILK